MVVIWLASPRDDAIPRSFFVSYQIRVAEGKQWQTAERNEYWIVSVGLGSSLPAGLKRGSEHMANSVSHK